MQNMKKTTAVILAAGAGRRMNSELTKQRIAILGKTVLYRAVVAFERAKTVDDIVVVCRDDEIDFVKSELEDISKLRAVVTGGETRRESAAKGFLAAEEADFVAIHDAARCMITPSLVDEVITAAHAHGAASAVSLVTDTVKMLDEEGMIASTVSRDTLRFAATPQVFSASDYSFVINKNYGEEITDDNMMLELLGAKIFPVDTGKYNFKITTRQDIEYAEFLIEKGYVDE